MEVTKIHDQFVLLAQQMGMKTVRAILPEQIDELINLETINYVRDMFSRKGNREVGGVSDNVIRLEELDSLLVNANVSGLVKGNVIFGTGYKISLNTKPMADNKLMFLIATTSSTGGAVAKCRLIDIELVSQTQNDYHSKSVMQSPICYKTTNTIEILGSFDVDSVVVTYIKYPTLINMKDNITNEMSDVAMQKIIERAVNTYNAISDNNSYEKVSNELSKLE